MPADWQNALAEDARWLTRNLALLQGQALEPETVKALRELRGMVQGFDPPTTCEGCENPAEHYDDDGVPLCCECWQLLGEETLREFDPYAPDPRPPLLEAKPDPDAPIGPDYDVDEHLRMVRGEED